MHFSVSASGLFSRSVYLISIILLDCALAIALAYVPITGATLLLKRSSLMWVGIGVGSLAMLNSGNVVVSVVFFVLMTLMLIHRLLWPLLLRPVYALQRYGVIQRKKTLWGVGLLLWFGPKGWELLKAILKLAA